MKINNKFLIKTLNVDELVEDMVASMRGRSSSGEWYALEKETKQKARNLVTKLYDKNKKKYLFSKKVMGSLESIKINKIDYNLLAHRKTQSGIFIIDKDRYYTFLEKNNSLRVALLERTFTQNEQTNIGQIITSFFFFQLNEEKFSISDNTEDEKWETFLKLIIYLDFLPITTVYIDTNKKHIDKDKNKIYNALDDGIIYVNKDWNQEYKTKEGTKFISRAHWGVRWTGKGRVKPKLVFVKSSLKQMTRKARRIK